MQKILLLVPIILCFQHALASESELTIVDQTGQPLENAIVSLGMVNHDADSRPQKKLAIMDQVNSQFLPRVLTVKAGSQVAFPNSDNIRHHVYSFSSAKAFEIKLYSGTASAPITFEKPGLVVLGCNIHDRMIGYIYVGQNNQDEYEQLLISDVQGKVELPAHINNRSASNQKVSVWHELLSDITSPVELTLTQLNDSQGKITLEVKTPEKAEKPTRFKSKFGGD